MFKIPTEKEYVNMLVSYSFKRYKHFNFHSKGSNTEYYKPTSIVSENGTHKPAPIIPNLIIQLHYMIKNPMNNVFR
jgi:hypothetical protein